MSRDYASDRRLFTLIGCLLRAVRDKKRHRRLYSQFIVIDAEILANERRGK